MSDPDHAFLAWLSHFLNHQLDPTVDDINRYGRFALIMLDIRSRLKKSEKPSDNSASSSDKKQNTDRTAS